MIELYKIGTENETKVYKKTNLGNIGLIVICALLLLAGIFFGTTCYFRSKLNRTVERYRVELELARARSEQYESIYKSAKSTNRELGECLSKSTATLSELREQLREIRRRYEEMENLLDSVGNDNGNFRSNDNGFDSNASE